MKRGLPIIISAFLLVGNASLKGQSYTGDFKEIISKEDNILTLATENNQLMVEFCTPSIVRFRTSWDGNFAPEEDLMVTQYNWPAVSWGMEEKEDEFILATEELEIRIKKNPVSIDIYDNQGKLLSSESKKESDQYGAFLKNQIVGSTKFLFEDEHFFGFGERMDFLNRRGKKLRLDVGRGIGRPHIIGAYNILEANYVPIPFFMSTKGYGIFFHTSYATTWDMGLSTDKAYSFQAEGGELDYYFIHGPKFPEILDGYTSITGKSPLLPKFALGLHVGTYSGGTWGHEEKTSSNYPVALVEKFRELEIPIDVLHLDSTWRIFGENGGSGATTFEWRETFENPGAMFDSLYALDLNMVGLHVRPRFDNGKELKLLDRARKGGYVYPEENNSGEFINFFDSKSVDWWWENGAMEVVKLGAMFFKSDEGSAFGRKANESDKTGPQGPEINYLHNVFPIAYAKAPFEKFQEHNNMRGMNHVREGYAGIQRYPFLWAGDWPSEWQYFEPVIKAGLNIGMSGVGYWSHNMGGFEHVADPELYIRWSQFGMFSPIAHLFGMEHPTYKEPWNYGEEAQEIFRKYDRLRYSLIPYLYSESYKMHKTGMPIMRALVLEYQDDPNVYEISDQYLLGDNLMICPVTTKGAKTRLVYLPQGNWINYWTGERLAGKEYYNVLTPLDEMPIFVKAGAIIPTQKPLNFIGEEEIDQIILDIYPEGNSNFTLYDDDGRSLDYQQGDFSLTEIQSSDDHLHTEIIIQSPKGKFKPSTRTYVVNLHSEEEYEELSVNGRTFAFSEGGNNLVRKKENGSLEITPPGDSDKDIEIILSKKR